MKIIAFNGKRDEYNTARQLQDGKKMITPPRERLINKAIQKLSTYSSNRNVDNLLGIAAANQYGLRANSALKKYMDEKSSISGTVMENNNWDMKLQEATQKAIKKLAKNRREKFLQRYDEIFVQPQALTSIEKKIIKYRENIINSKPMQIALADEKLTKETSKALKFLDYFIASSETPIKEKAYILLKLSYLMSDAYSIHEQLKNKKFQVFSEIINDLVIKLPIQEEFTTKECSQKKHGSCAATSAARKTLLYEDKTAYIDSILSELDDKPYMEIYDVTRLFEYQKNPEMYEKYRAPKVKVDKAQINYDRATFENYRIIDAAALNWMKNAGTIGDGTLTLKDYVAFDARHKGLLHDSFIYKLDDENYADEHAYLRVIIKASSFIKEYEKAKMKEIIKNKELKQEGLSTGHDLGIVKKAIEKELKKIDFTITLDKIKSILEKSTDYLYINTLNNDKELKKQIENLLISELGKEKTAIIKATSDKFIPLIRKYVKSKENNSKLFTTDWDKFKLNEKLFKIGVAQREFLLHQLKVEKFDKNAYFDEMNMPDYTTQLKQHVLKLIKTAQTHPNSEIIQKLQKKHNMNNEDLQKFLNNIHLDLAEEVQTEIDKLLDVYNVDYKTILTESLKRGLRNHLNGDYALMYSISDKTNSIPDVKNFEQLLRKVIEKIDNATSYTEISESIQPLGAQNPYELIKKHLDYIVNNINNQIQEKGFESVVNDLNIDKEFTNEDELVDFINNQNNKITDLMGLINVAADAVLFPRQNDLIVKLYEKRGEVLSEKELNELKNKIDIITAKKEENMHLREAGIDTRFDNSILHFSKEQKQILDKIEKEIPSFVRVVKREYKNVNNSMKKQLDELYQQIGRRDGHFWLREEGQSGLFPQQSIRILEQMTGRPYYNEADSDALVDHILAGKGSGTSGIQVSWSELGGHAQYIADIGTIKVKNPKTGKIEEKKVILHDNTWGHSEKRKYWIDNNGVGRTDYDREFGPKEGFVLNESLLAGVPIDNFKYDYSLNTKKLYKKAVDGPQSEISVTEYIASIFDHAQIPGIDPSMEKNLHKVLKYLLSIGSPRKEIDSIFEMIENPKNRLNVDFINEFDSMITKKQEEILEKIIKNNKPVITMEQYNKLQENDPLKIIIEKIIIVKQFPELINNDFVNSQFGNIRTHKALEKFKQKKLEEYKQYFREISFKVPYKSGFNAAIDETMEEIDDIIKKIEEKENIKLKSLRTNIKIALEKSYKKDYDGVLDALLEDISYEVEKAIKSDTQGKTLSKSDIATLILCAIDTTEDAFKIGDIEEFDEKSDLGRFFKFLDNKFNNIDNDDLVETHRSLLRFTKEEFEEVIKDLTFEDLGIKFDTPENVIKLIQADNMLEQKRLDKVIFEHYFDELMKPAMNTADKNLNIIYRNMHVDLSEFFGPKYINKYKNMCFNKYKIRPAIPNLEIKNKQELIGQLKYPIDNLQTSIIQMKSLEKGRNCLFNLQRLSDLIEYGDIKANKKEIKGIAVALVEEMKTDEACDKALEIIRNMLAQLEEKEFNKELIQSYYLQLKGELNNIISNTSLKTINSELKIARKTLVGNLEYLVKANVLPKYQAGVTRLFNKWLELATKEKTDKKVTSEALNIAIGQLLSHHVLTNPAELLTHTVKLAQKPASERNEIDQSALEQLKEYLIDAYKKVNCIKLEFRLMSMAEKGLATKTRDFLANHVKTKSQESFLNAGGMSVIRTALQDPSNDNATLILFVEQTGLIDELLNSIYKEDYKIAKKTARKVSSQFIAAVQSRVYLKALFDEFFANQKDINNVTKAELLDVMGNYLEVLLESKSNKKLGAYIDKYWTDFKRVIQNIEIPENSSLKDVLMSVHESCLAEFDNELYYCEQQLNSVLNSLYSDINLLNSMKIIDLEKNVAKREAHLEKIDKVIEYIHSCANFLRVVKESE